MTEQFAALLPPPGWIRKTLVLGRGRSRFPSRNLVGPDGREPEYREFAARDRSRLTTADFRLITADDRPRFDKIKVQDLHFELLSTVRDEDNEAAVLKSSHNDYTVDVEPAPCGFCR